MAKGNFVKDTFEQIAELGGSTVKHGAKQINKTFNPLNMLPSSEGTVDSDSNLEKKAETNEKAKSTPLNFDKLNQKYAYQDKQKLDMMRNRLHNLVKNDELRAIDYFKKREEERKRKEQMQEQEKKKKLHAQMQQPNAVPKGKQRKSILSPKKKAQMEHQETKPSTGK